MPKQSHAPQSGDFVLAGVSLHCQSTPCNSILLVTIKPLRSNLKMQSLRYTYFELHICTQDGCTRRYSLYTFTEMYCVCLWCNASATCEARIALRPQLTKQTSFVSQISSSFTLVRNHRLWRKIAEIWTQGTIRSSAPEFMNAHCQDDTTDDETLTTIWILQTIKPMEKSVLQTGLLGLLD